MSRALREYTGIFFRRAGKPATPWCFESMAQLKDWVEAAHKSHEPCTICEDCTVEYQLEMESAGRCDHEYWSKKIAVSHAKRIQRLKSTPLGKAK